MIAEVPTPAVMWHIARLQSPGRPSGCRCAIYCPLCTGVRICCKGIPPPCCMSPPWSHEERSFCLCVPLSDTTLHNPHPHVTVAGAREFGSGSGSGHRECAPYSTRSGGWVPIQHTADITYTHTHTHTHTNTHTTSSWYFVQILDGEELLSDYLTLVGAEDGHVSAVQRPPSS